MKSEESKNPSEQETAYSIYVKTGLSTEEVAKKLQQYGPNEIPEKKASPFRKFLGYFWGPIPWMIEIASVLSIIIQHYDDFAIIFTLLIVNAVVGFWQERKADNAIELLKKRLAPKARVLRDGTWHEIPSKELVPGDIVRVRLGDIVPADVKLMKGDLLARRRIRVNWGILALQAGLRLTNVTETFPKTSHHRSPPPHMRTNQGEKNP